jgi:hypothetical protein
MQKTLTLALNRFATIPHSLREEAATNSPRREIDFNLGSLYHHYYLDSYGRTPPDPDPAQFEYLRFLLPTGDFRLRGDGIGASTVTRRHSSTALGQAFCRMFLHDHLGIAYFAHMEHVLDRAMHPAFSTIRVERIQAGDTPDYFCAENVNKVFLSEAKGRYPSINFSNKEFAKWRTQFTRVAVKESNGRHRRVKGYIVATRFATEEKPSLKSGIFAEDPDSPGELPLAENQSGELGAAIMALHYSDIAMKLGQPILASALFNGFVVPEEIRFPVTIWEVRVGPLQHMRFVGGFYQSMSGSTPFRATDKGLIFDPIAPFRLDIGSSTFVGVEESIFRNVAAMTRLGPRAAGEVTQLVEQIEPFYSGFSLLRDGSVIGPIEFFAPVAQAAL